MAENTKSDSNKPQKQGSPDPKQGSPEKTAGNQDRARESMSPSKTKPAPEVPADPGRQSQNSPNRMAPDKASVDDDLDLDLDDEDDRAAQRTPGPGRDDRDDKV
jgi:hypothetical protein